MHAAIGQEIRHRGAPVEAPACVISGGETTVTLAAHGNGTGGRNQEFVLAAALDIAGLERVVVLSGGTDGSDGPTDAAGAIADGQTVARAQAHGWRPDVFLYGHNAYPFFHALGDLLITGPTGTNVMDMHLLLVG
jgi:hydroxypyruvate reductase